MIQEWQRQVYFVVETAAPMEDAWDWAQRQAAEIVNTPEILRVSVDVQEALQYSPSDVTEEPPTTLVLFPKERTDANS